jgi:hypothetical protein
MNKCYLLNCDIEPDEPTLEEIMNSGNQFLAEQAKLLIETHRFPKTARLCDSCFWA